jgi:hypothetical protein
MREVTVMTVHAISSTNVERPLGGEWVISVCVTDADGDAVDQAPVVTVTLPAGTTATPTVETLTTGVYRAVYELGTAGRYIARAAAAGYGVATFVAFSTDVTGATAMPDLDDVDAYLGDDSHTDEERQDALDAEAAAQRAVCRVPAAYPADLRQALLRRVQRNLAMRGQPGVIVADDDRPSFVPTNDPEVRRLERPHRKLVMG